MTNVYIGGDVPDQYPKPIRQGADSTDLAQQPRRPSLQPIPEDEADAPFGLFAVDRLGVS